MTIPIALLRILLICIFAVAIVLGVRIYDFDPKSRLYKVSMLSLFCVALLAFIEYEITHIVAPDVITRVSIYHTSVATVLVTMAAWAAKLFADDGRKIAPWIWNILLALLWVLAIVLLYGLIFTSFNPDYNHQLVRPGFWKYHLKDTGFFSVIYHSFFIYAVSFMSFCYFISFLTAKKKHERRWKFLLFITYFTLPFGMIYFFVVRIGSATSGDYFISPILACCVFVLGWVYTNFKLFEISPAAAVYHILDSMSNLTLIVDGDFKIKFINEAVSSRFNVSTKRMMDLPLEHSLERIQMDDWQKHVQAVLKLQKGQRHEADFSVTWNEKKHYYLAVITPVFNAKQLKTGYVIVATDLTRVKASEVELREHANQLEKSNKELERFAYIASHDLKSPLRNIISFSNLLEKRLAKETTTEIKDYLQFIITNSRYMYTLVQDVLEYSLVKKQAAKMEPVPLEEVLQVVLRNLSPMIEKKHAAVQYEDLPSIISNFSLMQQLLQNLIENGLKYNHSERPLVRVEWEKTEDRHFFSIADNGIGIEADYQKQIFTMFKRLHPQSTFEGTGIGLAICEKIVELHGGEIWLESDEGCGSTFFFSIPDIETSSTFLNAAN